MVCWGFGANDRWCKGKVECVESEVGRMRFGGSGHWCGEMAGCGESDLGAVVVFGSGLRQRRAEP